MTPIKIISPYHEEQKDLTTQLNLIHQYKYFPPKNLQNLRAKNIYKVRQSIIQSKK
jgi:hypothetical protein